MLMDNLCEKMITSFTLSRKYFVFSTPTSSFLQRLFFFLIRAWPDNDIIGMCGLGHTM